MCWEDINKMAMLRREYDLKLWYSSTQRSPVCASDIFFVPSLRPRTSSWRRKRPWLGPLTPPTSTALWTKGPGRNLAQKLSVFHRESLTEKKNEKKHRISVFKKKKKETENPQENSSQKWDVQEMVEAPMIIWLSWWECVQKTFATKCGVNQKLPEKKKKKKNCAQKNPRGTKNWKKVLLIFCPWSTPQNGNHWWFAANVSSEVRRSYLGPAFWIYSWDYWCFYDQQLVTLCVFWLFFSSPSLSHAGFLSMWPCTSGPPGLTCWPLHLPAENPLDLWCFAGINPWKVRKKKTQVSACTLELSTFTWVGPLKRTEHVILQPCAWGQQINLWK